MPKNEKFAGQRERSPSYPLISLKVALDRLREFEDHFKRTPADPSKIGAAWGLKSKSQIDRSIAALRYFGLLEYQKSSNGHQVVLSEEGRKYVRAQQEEIKQKVARDAALRPKVIAEFWHKWGENRPADAVCLDNLVFSNAFSTSGAKRFLKVYDATIAFAGFSKSDKIESDYEDDSSTNDDSADAVLPNDTQSLQQPHRLRQEGQTGMKEDVFTLAEGDVILKWPELLSRDSFEDLKAWTEIVFRKIERKVVVNELLDKPVSGSMATQYTDDEEGRDAEIRDRELDSG